jgi:hypothetical protein
MTRFVEKPSVIITCFNLDRYIAAAWAWRRSRSHGR